MPNKLSQTSEREKAFLGSSYGVAGARAYLSPVPMPIRPPWAAHRYAILTAYNSLGKLSTPAANAEAQACLEAELRRLGLPYLRGHNGEGQWREETFIVAGMSLRQACAVGDQYAQAAVLWGAGRRVALVWLEDEVWVERYWWRVG